MILYWCHYVIGLAVSKLKCEYKDVHAQTPRGLSRGRGQTKKLATALTRKKRKKANLTGLEDSGSSDNSDNSDPSSVKRKAAIKKNNEKNNPQKFRQKSIESQLQN